MQPDIKFFPSQRLKIAYSDWSAHAAEDARPLILVHGGRDQKRSWDWVARDLCRNFKIYAHDLRGHGQSDWVSDGDYSIMDHVYDLNSFIDYLQLDEFYLLGHSLGGNIATRYAGIFPEKITKFVAIEGLGPSPKLIAERAGIDIQTRTREWIADRQKHTARKSRILPNLEAAIARMHEAHPWLSDDQARHLALHGIKDNADGSVSWAYDPSNMGRSPSDISIDEFYELMGQITCPIWLVYGAKSWASNPEKDGRLKHFQNAKVTEYLNGDHWVHHDSFDEFMRDLKTFLDLA